MLSLFRINACFLNENIWWPWTSWVALIFFFFFDIIATSQIRITKKLCFISNLNLNNYFYEFTLTETSAGGTLLYIANHLSYKCCYDLNIYKKINWNVFLLKFSTQKNQILLWESFTHTVSVPWLNSTRRVSARVLSQ